MTNSPLVSIIIVSFNTRSLTIECLRSVFAETRNTDFEIILVDNASVDGSGQAIRNEFGHSIKIIELTENIGFAAANNYAAGVANGEFLLLLNPDTVVLDGAIDRLIQFARQNPDAKIWGGRTLFHDRSLNPASCWGKQTVWSLLSQAVGFSSVFRRSNLFNPEGMGGWDRQGQRAVDIVSGCFLLIRREFWERLEGFQSVFFMYGEEADLCLRAQKYGARPMVSSDATIIHYGGASERVRADKIIRLLKAKALLIKIHFPIYMRALGLALLSTWPATRFLVHRMLAYVGRLRSQQQSEVWAEVIRRKGDWLT
jgi:GT2 family glycosyltransferase